MPTRDFPEFELNTLIKYEDELDGDNDVSYTFIAIEETHEVVPCTDGLAQWNLLYFEVDGVTYRVKFIASSAYYQNEVGSWEGDLFEDRDNNDFVTCTAVEIVATTTYSYQPVK